MKKKIFTLLTLALLSIGTAWAADVTVKRSIAYLANGGTTDAVHEFTGYNDGVNDIIIVTADETAGSLTGTASKTRNVTYNGKETKYSAAKVYRNKNASGNDVYNDSYDDNCYVGIKLVIADGYRIDVSQLKAQVGVGDGNFKYKLVVTDGTHDLYTSADKTAKKANENISTISITTPNKLVVCGTVYLRMYFTIKNGGTSKYIQPFELSLTGDVATAPKYTITTVASPDGAGTITGAGSYYENQDVFLNATPNGGYGFVNWTVGGEEKSTSASYSFKAGAANATYTANFEVATFYTITGEISDGQSAYGSITNEGANNVNENGNITFVATPNEGYAFVKWQKDGADFDGNTAASIEVTATADATYTAIFKKLFTVTYNISSYALTNNKALNNYSGGVNEKYAGANDKYTIPAYSHYYMYREGYIFSKWKDQDEQEYEKGTEYTLTKDITLTPVWVATTQTLANSSSETSVTWNLKVATILFNEWQGTSGYYTKPLTVNGELIAVPMTINTTTGKVSNIGRNDNWSQTNVGTTFTIPAVKGMTVTVSAYTAFSTTTVAGSTEYTKSNSDKTLTYTYNGEDPTIDIVIGENNQYLSTIIATYPKMTEMVTIGATGWSTFSSSYALDFENATKANDASADLAAYMVTGAAGTAITKSAAVTNVPGNTGLLLNGTASAVYYVPVLASSATSTTGNLMKACVTETTVNYDDNNSLNYVLVNNSGTPEFQKIVSGTYSSATIPAGKAYLALTSDPGARALTLFDDMTTGINAVNGEGLKVQGAEVYNLAGQRVLNPTKGLYIVNGKKVVVK